MGGVDEPEEMLSGDPVVRDNKDGLYDPMSFNDRLLLGLKEAMSETELTSSGPACRAASSSKARRSELTTPLPVGLVYDMAVLWGETDGR